MTYLPDQGPCYRCLFPHSAAGVAPNCAEAGVLGVLPGVLGALQATEVIKVILGIGAPLVGRLMTYDALAMEWHQFRFGRRSDCAVCGAEPSIRTPADSEAAGRGEPAGPWPRVKPLELQQLLAAGNGPRARAPLLVDVRERHEFAVGHVAGSVNIPLGDLSARIGELPPESPVIFLCRSGSRSRAACELAAGGGVRSVADLEGGVACLGRGHRPIH